METNKQLTPKQQQQRKKLLVYPLFACIFLVVMYIIFAPSGAKTESGEQVNGLNADIPLPKEQGIVTDKKTAYEEAEQKKKEEDKLRTLQDFAFSLNGENEELNLQPDSEAEPERETYPSDFSGHLQSSNNAYRDMTKELNNLYEPDDTEKEELKKQVEDLTRQIENTPAGTGNDQIDIMEKSYQLAAKYLNPGTTGNSPENQTAQAEPARRDNPATVRVKGHTGQIVSRLEQPLSDSAFMAEYVKPRNLGFHTAANRENTASRNTINACVYDNQVLEFGSGEDTKVRFRLLEDIQADALIIPRNTPLSGDAKLQNGRLEIEITSLEYAGNILPVKLQIYDLEGQKGIKAPGSAETDALKEAAGTMGGNMGTAITFTQNAGQQVASDLAKTAVQTGAQYLSKKIKTVRITLKAGHQVYLLPLEK